MRASNKSIVFLLSLLCMAIAVCNAQEKLKQEDIFAKQSKNKSAVELCLPIVGHQHFTIVSNPMPIIKYCLPKGGIFCQMESAIHQRLNFWIKFRMGTDDRCSD